MQQNNLKTYIELENEIKVTRKYKLQMIITILRNCTQQIKIPAALWNYDTDNRTETFLHTQKKKKKKNHWKILTW